MRRRTLIAGLGAAAAAVAAGLYRFTDLFVKHYAPTPWDDVLARLEDREEAAKLGAAMHDAPDAAALAARLRPVLGKQSLAAAALADIGAGRMTEADGWVLPESIALLSALAAKAGG